MAWFFSGYSVLLGFNGYSISNSSHPWTILFIILAMTGSFMVSYCRARAEGLGLECNIGIMQRPERITLIVLGSLLSVIPGIGLHIIKMTLLVLAVSTNITAIHRILYVKNQLSSWETS
jgi:CDP-diacylglycerol--glycerol-3-phosphate 3-phosphatidyltransferase